MNTAKPYFDTTNLPAQDRDQAETAARGQEALILAFYRHNAGGLYTPSQVRDRILFQLKGAPLTSVRRAITQLERKGLLVKTATQRIGPYGRPEHCWTATTNETIQLSLL